MVDVSFEGREYAPFGPYLVGREKIREFASAVGATLAHHHDVAAARAAGYADVVAPTTFAVVIAQRAESQLIEDPAAGIDFSRVVHADERFDYARPLVAGDEVLTILHVDSIKERAGLALVSTRCEIVSAADPQDRIATVRSTLAVRAAETNGAAS
ncbi:MaoC family dehydratase N-terminal domain-containing protein [Rarobacter faecitabidus]|uniref:UPF0336 protein FB461_0242 n=1 Tax=Rarobacter faecitabidus TaxID=13243 RepID=A0A542ZU32_RARFA|nr:MaoC family dehydratase N-terminal domain-containing protein [Rarobacter faecitabidus]TQL63766.1 MaoC dehydratase-like protein [Rarobacter faecitabidus]